MDYLRSEGLIATLRWEAFPQPEATKKRSSLRRVFDSVVLLKAN